MSYLFLLAQEQAPQMGPINPITITLMLVVVWIVVLIPMQRRQKRQQQQMLASVKRNDKVITTGGIIGVVVAIKEDEDEVTIRTDDASNTRIRILRGAIARVVPSGTPAPTEPAKT